MCQLDSLQLPISSNLIQSQPALVQLVSFFPGATQYYPVVVENARLPHLQQAKFSFIPDVDHCKVFAAFCSIFPAKVQHYPCTPGLWLWAFGERARVSEPKFLRLTAFASQTRYHTCFHFDTSRVFAREF